MIDIINSILKDNLKLGYDFKIEPDMPIQDLGADSLNVVEIVMDLETEFDIEIDDTEIESIKTPKDVYELVQNLV